MRPFRVRSLLALPALLGVLGQTGAAQTGVTLVVDNDYFNFWQTADRRPDVDYTQGVILTVRLPAGLPHVLRWMGRGMPCDRTVPAGVACTRLGLSLGQAIYTPWHDSPVLLRGDRPYAGWLHISGEMRHESHTALDGATLTVGVTGPPSLAEPVQTRFHQWFGFRTPQGWDQQLPFEPGVQLGLDGARRVMHLGEEGRLELGVSPTWRALLGTVAVSGTLGTVAMFGWRPPPPWPGPRK